MAESTLALAYNDLVQEVGLFLGYGKGTLGGEVAWTTQQANAIDSCVRSGVRQFYFPPPLQGTDSPYDWSFIKPTATLTLAQNANTLALPDDFGGFEGEITLVSTVGLIARAITLINEGQIRERYTLSPNVTGRPDVAALQPLKGTTPTRSQRWQLFFYPTADQAYPIQFQYYLLPDCLTGALPYVYGGAAHAETVLESCLAIAEQRLDDSSAVHSLKFQERLAASIGIDRKSKAQVLGYNRDSSDSYHWDRRWQHYNDTILISGVQYGLLWLCAASAFMWQLLQRGMT